MSRWLARPAALGRDDLIIDFGPQSGIWVRMNNATWELLHASSAQRIAAGQIDGN